VEISKAKLTRPCCRVCQGKVWLCQSFLQWRSLYSTFNTSTCFFNPRTPVTRGPFRLLSGACAVAESRSADLLAQRRLWSSKSFHNNVPDTKAESRVLTILSANHDPLQELSTARYARWLLLRNVGGKTLIYSDLIFLTFLFLLSLYSPLLPHPSVTFAVILYNMPSSSLFLRSSATLVVALSLLTSSNAYTSDLYELDTTYAGDTFFDGFDFFTVCRTCPVFDSFTDSAATNTEIGC
jgi:hypothetical protein